MQEAFKKKMNELSQDNQINTDSMISDAINTDSMISDAINTAIDNYKKKNLNIKKVIEKKNY